MSISSEKPLVNREYSLRMPKNFQRPSNLLQRIYEQQIALEDMFTRGITVYGTVRVNNISFHKHVSIRFTIDQWKTSSTIDAHHMVYYSDTNTDLFQFKLTLQKEKLQSLSIVARSMSFAICYDVNRREFWDNNYSRNYNLHVIESRATDEQIKSILYDDWFHRQIVQDYHAISKVSKQTQELCGLKNLGGTCYMNSVLQSLSLTSLLTDILLTEKEFSIEIRSYSEGTILNEYLNLLLLLSCGDYCVLTPNPFKQIFGHLNSAYFKNQQQDAHEFLLLLLDCLDKDITKIKSENKNQNINQTENNLTFLDLFYGSYKTTTTCLQCQQSSARLEPFICLSLPISSTNQCTLQDCLASVSQCEYLTDDSKWFCPVCKNLCDAERRLEIEKFPKILIIQFKRFELNFEQKWMKNNTLVLYPEDNFDVKQYCFSPPTAQTLYTLYSVINHNGSINDGHYTTFSRNQSQWFECDDDQIKSLPSDKLHFNSKAYLLFYTLNQTSE